MGRELTKNEFYQVKRSYDDAEELLGLGEYKSALAALRPGLRLLERDALRTRFLAKAYVLQARILEKLDRPAAAVWQAALECASAIGDEELVSDIEKFVKIKA